MNKQQLIDQVAKSSGTSKAGASRVVQSVLGGIESGLKKGGRVQLIGFGTFRVKNRAARQGRNPATGETITIKASKTVGFKPGAELKGSL
tara:strand:- start:194 stop:463 length:270 start_codon:yes stop_codon:yes gene_type:complete